MCSFLNRRLKPELSNFAKDQRYAGPVPHLEAVRASAVRFLFMGLAVKEKKDEPEYEG
jgi:hypothetical protein